MKIVDLGDKDSLQNAARVLKRGGILVFPTDTVYGIGCLLNTGSIKRLYTIKNRPLSQPTAILMTSKMFKKTYQYRIKHDKFQNGKLTLLLSAKSFMIGFPNLLIKDGKIGIRIPKYHWLKDLLNTVGPMVTSSANKKGQIPPAEFEAVDQDILEKADLTIRTDAKLSGKPSRVYDIELKKYLR